jgi:hypothetical protein
VSHLLLFAADEPSKVPFYIGGGALAVWAVVLAALGLNRPDFPGNRGGERGVMAISLVLIIVAIGAAVTSG